MESPSPDTLREQNIQKQVRHFWDQNNIHAQTQSRKASKVTIYDGPPFPNGPPHHGHTMTSAVKDTVARYLAATGHYVPRQIGWDMYGPNNPPLDMIEAHISEWHQTLSQLGRWTDGDSYRTSSSQYKQSVWWVFKMLWDKGYLRVGYGITPYCQCCDLYYSDFERYQHYCSVTENTVYYKVPTSCCTGPIKEIMVWEMWPWTLTGVVGYAVGALENYVVDRHGTMMSRTYAATYVYDDDVKEVEPDWLKGLLILNPFAEDDSMYVPIIVDDVVDVVDSDKGTGVIRLAPSMDVRSRDIIERHPAIFPKETVYKCPKLVSSESIISVLKEKKLFHSDRVINRTTCSCPKCRSRLITYPCHGIYYNIKDHRTAIKKTLETIYWEPRSSKERILQYVQSANDWLITRSTRVGIPVPIWKTMDTDTTDEYLVIGSYAELNEYGLDPDMVRDQSTPLLTYRGKQYQRCRYQFDNWFDSACMPYGSVGYPFQTNSMDLFPCLLAIEGVDQVHGWFFTTNVISNSLFGVPAFKNIITNGLVLHNGVKMSKSKSKSKSESMPESESESPQDAMNKYGADTYRVYLMQNRLLSGYDFNYDQNKINNNFTRSIINVYTSIQNILSQSSQRSTIQFKPTKITNITDNWILQTLDNYLEQYHQLMGVFKVARALSLCTSFLNSIKKFMHYNRTRLQGSDSIAISVLIRAFYYYLLTVAPFIPHISEFIYQELRIKYRVDGVTECISVHLCTIPTKQWRVNKDFLSSSSLMFRIIDLINKVPAEIKTIRVYIHESTFSSLVKTLSCYIGEITGKDIIYQSGLPVKASVIVQNHNVFTKKDIEILGNMTLDQIIQMDDLGYYRNSQGNNTYPGQYIIKYEPTISHTYCGCGVLIQPIQNTPDKTVLIIKGQLIARKLLHQLRKLGRSVIYLDRPAHPEPLAKELVDNINRYTLPILKQTIYPKSDSDSEVFATVNITVFETTLVFYFTSIPEVQKLH